MSEYFNKTFDVMSFKQVCYTPTGTPNNNWCSLPFSGGTISNSGCPLVSMAMLLRYYGKLNTPLDLYNKGNFASGYGNEPAANLYGMTRITHDGTFNSLKGQIFEQLCTNDVTCPVMVYGRDANTGNQHYVVIRGFSGSLSIRGYDTATGKPIYNYTEITPNMFIINDPGTFVNDSQTLDVMINHYKIDKASPVFDITCWMNLKIKP